MNISLKIILAMMILLNFSCSSKNQNSELTEANSLQTVNQDWGIIAPELRKTSKVSTYDPNIKITKITGEINDDDIFQGRDISLYEKTDTSKCGNYKCIERKMRNFIWEHWKNKKRGYIKHKRQGIDVSFTEHIFIEPDSQEHWRVIWRTEIHQISDTVNKSIKDYIGINSIERVKGNEELIFKNSVGETVRTF
ncbi:hypothetical protein BH20ACI1_BH20ACI1_17490 [soil metagenome]